jgi:hypothetical protein
MSLVDTMIGMMILAIGSLAFTALVPVMARGQKMSQEVSVATQIATREIEQIRLAGYANMQYAELRTLGLVDEWSGSGPLLFSHVSLDESVRLSAATALKNGIGELDIQDPAQNIKTVVVTVRWTSPTGKARSVAVSSLFAKDYR